MYLSTHNFLVWGEYLQNKVKNFTLNRMFGYHQVNRYNVFSRMQENFNIFARTQANFELKWTYGEYWNEHETWRKSRLQSRSGAWRSLPLGYWRSEQRQTTKKFFLFSSKTVLPLTRGTYYWFILVSALFYSVQSLWDIKDVRRKYMTKENGAPSSRRFSDVEAAEMQQFNFASAMRIYICKKNQLL